MPEESAPSLGKLKPQFSEAGAVPEPEKAEEVVSSAFSFVYLPAYCPARKQQVNKRRTEPSLQKSRKDSFSRSIRTPERMIALFYVQHLEIMRMNLEFEEK